MVTYGVCFWQGVIMTVVVYRERGLRGRDLSRPLPRDYVTWVTILPHIAERKQTVSSYFEVNSKILSIVFLFGLIIDTVCLGRVLSCMTFYWFKHNELNQ